MTNDKQRAEARRKWSPVEVVKLAQDFHRNPEKYDYDTRNLVQTVLTEGEAKGRREEAKWWHKFSGDLIVAITTGEPSDVDAVMALRKDRLAADREGE